MGYQPNVVNKGDVLIINGRRFEAKKDFNAQTDTVLKLRLVENEKTKTIFVVGEDVEKRKDLEKEKIDDEKCDDCMFAYKSRYVEPCNKCSHAYASKFILMGPSSLVGGIKNEQES